MSFQEKERHDNPVLSPGLDSKPDVGILHITDNPAINRKFRHSLSLELTSFQQPQGMTLFNIDFDVRFN